MIIAKVTDWDGNGECEVSNLTAVVGVLGTVLTPLTRRSCRATGTVLSFVQTT